MTWTFIAAFQRIPSPLRINTRPHDLFRNASTKALPFGRLVNACTNRSRTAVLYSLGLSLVWSLAGAADEPAKTGPDVKQWNNVVDKAINYLKSSQSENGSWSGNKSPGVTGVILTGLLDTGKVGPDNPLVTHALAYIESLVNTKAHHIAGKEPSVQLQNYVTSVNVMALKAADRTGRTRKSSATPSSS